MLLLAGGSGTRFWPLSRGSRPKQFLPLAGKRPLLVETWRRALRLAPAERVWVIAPKALARDIRRMLPDLRRGNLVLEPSPRDTAPAIALACAKLARRDPSAVACVFPTDHVIRDARAFTRSVRVAAAAAAEGALVCLGVTPDRPATGFGYLKCAARPAGIEAVKVDRFVEKPNEARAKRFLRSGRYLWNAGMFVWRVDRFLDELARTAPATRRAVESVLDGREKAWLRAEKLSVDFAVMEQATGVKVVPLRAGWDDVGSWEAAARLKRQAGLLDEGHLLVDTEDCAVFGDDRLVAVVGARGLTVVDTPDALLIVANDRSENVREVVARLRRKRRQDLL
jgi:mannose-1-phosphate guanylyltransferase/mannose-6-phosphate isomerase